MEANMTELTTRRGLLRWRTIADLTVAPGYPCISVLVPTTPAPRMLDADRRALHATPPHLILTLHPEVAHLFHAQGMTMTQVASITMGTGTARHQPTAQPSTLATDTFLAEVDYQLGQHRLAFPSPLVLAGPEALLATFTDRPATSSGWPGSSTPRCTRPRLTSCAAPPSPWRST